MVAESSFNSIMASLLYYHIHLFPGDPGYLAYSLHFEERYVFKLFNVSSCSLLSGKELRE